MSRSGHRFREAVMGGACLLALTAGGSAAFAQQAQQQADQQRPLEEIEITGTRIISSGMTAPTPVTTVQATELQYMSPGNLIESLGELPQFFNNQTTEQVNGGQNSGGSNVNLRGAGTNRTLVLLDGRRVTPSNRFGSADVGIFPKDLVQRVETVTGGASASYGTDAVAGVVNFILDTGFTGIKGHAQAGETQYGDGQNFEGSLAFGTDIGSRLHLLASAEFSREKAIHGLDSLSKRKWIDQRGLVTNPNYNSKDPNSGPRQLIEKYVSSTSFNRGGILLSGDPRLNHLTFTPDGGAVPLPFSGVGQLDGGCACQAEDSQSWGIDSDDELRAGTRRANAFLYLTYNASDNVQFYIQGMYGNNWVSDRRESISFLTNWIATVFSDNPYLPENVRQIMQEDNVSSARLGYAGLNEAGTPLGDARQVTENNLYQGTIGFKSEIESGGFLDHWHIDGYGQWGQNIQDYDSVNSIRVDNLPLAMDVVTDPKTGTPVCYAALHNPDWFGDCVPINIFGGEQNISQAAAAYVTDDLKVGKQNTKAISTELIATGDVWKGIGAGPISAALGISYRKEMFNQYTEDPCDEFMCIKGVPYSPPEAPDARGLIPEDLPGGMPGVRPGSVPPGFIGNGASAGTVLFSSLYRRSGHYDVKEAFGELDIPVLADTPFFQKLSFSTAARYADYQGSGGIWAWKLGADWQISNSFRLRATRSRDVRAATLRERFDLSGGGGNVRDPEFNGDTKSIGTFSGGNPNVDPEKADTITAGIVFQPVFLTGFSTSVDWYRININNAIAQLGAQNIVDQCAAGDTALCNLIIRDPATNEITRLFNYFLNVANQRISGIDMEMRYQTDIHLLGGVESLTWRFFGSYLHENSIKDPGAPRDDSAGISSLPKYKFTTNLSYINGPFTVFATERWTDGGKLDRKFVEGVDVDDNHVKAAYYTDLHLAYSLGDDNSLTFYGDVTNVFNQAPSRTAGTVGRTGVGFAASSPSDTLGRRFVLGVRFNY
jgi:outer membrane receptor protein involved in Fe transport